MYCKRCGKYVGNGKEECPYCKCKELSVFNEYGKNYNQYKKVYDHSSFGYGLLGFLFPLVGLILYLVWKDEYPNRAESCFTGMLWGVVIIVLVWVLPMGCVTCLSLL